MSLNPTLLKTFRTEDPIVRVDNEREYGILKGANDVIWNQFPVSGSPSTSNNTILCNPSSRTTLVDRKHYLHGVFTLTFTGTAGASGLLVAGYDAPRSLPMSKCIQTLSVKIGDQEVTTNVNEYLRAIERYCFDRNVQDLDFSMTPSMPDQNYVYSSSGVALSERSELSSYNFNSYQVPRGFAIGSSGAAWYNISQVGSGSTAVATVVLDVVEPLFISPLMFGHGDHSAIQGVENMQVKVKFGDLTLLWSHAPSGSGSIVNNPSVVVNQLEVLQKQLTPDLSTVPPNEIPYAYSDLTRYQSSTSTSLAQNASASFKSGTITLTSIPTRIYVYVSQQDSDLEMTSTDTFAAINSIQMKLGTRVLIDTADKQQLYAMSVRAGCKMSYTQWASTCGSVVAIDFGKEVGLLPTEAAGLLARSNLQFTVNASNLSPTTINFMLSVVIIEEGTVVIANGHLLKSIGVLTQQNILDAKDKQFIPMRADRNIYGGAWYDDVWAGIKQGANFAVNDILPFAKQVAPYVLPLLGAGVTGGELEGGADSDANLDEYYGGKRKPMHKRELAVLKKHLKGKGLSGGKMIDRSEL